MLTDAQIAVLCDIGQSIAFDDVRRRDLSHLLIEGYVRKNGDIFKLTPKGEKVLTDRGAGLNES